MRRVAKTLNKSSNRRRVAVWNGVTPIAGDCAFGADATCESRPSRHRRNHRPPHTEQVVNMDVERLKKLAGSVRTGGKGTMRR